MTPAEFLNEIVLPTVQDFRDQRRSRRHAYLACIATFHLKDHLKAAGESGIEGKMRPGTGDAFDVVRGVCNGTKHVSTDASHVIAFQAGADYEVPSAILGELVLDRSRLDDATGGREIDGGSGQGVDLYGSVSATLKCYAATFPAHFTGCDLSGL